MAEQKWLQGLRRQIKHSCGPGWGLPLVSSTRSAPNCLHETPSKAPSTVYGQATEALTPYARRVGVLQARRHRESSEALLMQGAFELGLVALLFLGLQVWWLSKVFLNRPRQPKPIGKPMRANTLQGKRNALQRLFDQS